MTLLWPAKDPTEMLDYDLDWSQRLVSGDAIVGSTWTLPVGSALNVASANFFPTWTKVVLTGGTAGQIYVVTNTVTTSSGLVLEETVSLQIKAK